MRFTLCGSSRFENLWHQWNKRLGFMGHHSYALMTYPSIEGSKSWYTEEEKIKLDLLHLAKIEDSDAVLILNQDCYIGESTSREFQWAIIRQKGIYLLEPWNYNWHYPGVTQIPGWEGYKLRYGWPQDLKEYK